MKSTNLRMLIICLLFSTIATAQQYSTVYSSDLIESVLESIAEEIETNGESISILEDLNDLAANPINLNTATLEDLQAFFFLTDYQKQSLLSYRDQYQQIYSFFEIENIPGFNRIITSKLTPFVQLGNTKPYQFNVLRQTLNFRTTYTFEKANGFVANEGNAPKYSGIQPSLYLKYKANYGKKLNWGFTFENDSGEDFFHNSNKQGFDFNSGFLQYKPSKFVDQILIGDYGIRMGQGLIQWTGYSSRKSVENVGIRYYAQGIRPYTSTTENNFFRGIATEVKRKKLKYLLFASATKIDANLEKIYDEVYVTALQISGYHRTESEIDDENSLHTKTIGSSLHYSFPKFEFGLNGIFNQYALPIIPSDRLSNLFKFSGQNNYNASIDFHGTTKQLSYFGEIAMSRSKGKAMILGLEAQPANQLNYSLLYRNIDANFHSIGGSAFTEWKPIQNEQGLFSAVNFLPFAKTQFSTFVDLYQSKWLRYQSNAPVRGLEWALQLKYNPWDCLNITFRYKTENNFEKESSSVVVKQDLAQKIERTRLQLLYTPTDVFKMKGRIELSHYEKGDSVFNGILAFTEATFQPKTTNLNLTARIGWFNIDDYESRIYTYESDVPSLFYIPSFAGNGFRYYFISSYKINSKLTFYAKFAQTMFPKEVIAISTGNSEINNHHKSDLRIQLKYCF